MYQPRRRHRNTFVCTFCKRRKVRCDKGNPCSTCVKYGNANCEYISENHSGAKLGHDSAGGGEAGVLMEPIMEPMSLGAIGPTRSHSGSEASSTYSGGLLLKPAVRSELELLKEKIRQLEQLVTQSGTIDPGQQVQWLGQFASLGPSLLGYNPCASDDELFSFHNNYTPFLTNHAFGFRYCAPLSWISLVKVDNAVSYMFSYKRKNVILKRLMTTKEDTDDLKPAELFFREKITNEAALSNDGILAEASNTRSETKAEVRRLINEKARAFGLTVFEGDLEGTHDTLDKILLILPSLKVVWMLIDRFFARVYPFFPFIDQFDFEENIIRIFGTKSRAHEKIFKLNVEKKMDVVHLAMLLMVLRFGYLTLFSNSDATNEANLRTNDPSQRAQEIKFLMHNPIDIDFVDVAQLCLLQFGYLRVSNLPLLQLFLYMKLYYSFAPENGDSPEDTNSQAYTAMLVNMAIALGMHREPDNFKLSIRDEKLNNLCRKIWYYLLVIDLHGGMSNGLTPSLSRDMFDTSPPYYKPGNENVRDVEIEKEAVNALRRVDRCFDDLNYVVKKISVIGAPLHLKSLCDLLSRLEVEYIKDNQLFAMEPNGPRLVPIDVSQAVSTKINFQAKFFLVGIAFHLFNYYERQNQIDLAYFYLKKVISVTLFNTMPFYEDYVDNSHVWFQNTTDLAVTPSLQALAHKCMIVIQAVMARARFSQLRCEALPTHMADMASNVEYKRRYELLLQVFSLCDECLSSFVETLTRLSSRYYYSWRCVKAYYGLKSTREGTDYYLNYCKGREGYMLFTNDMLEDLIGVLQESLNLINKKQTKRQTPDPNAMMTDDVFGQPDMAPNGVPDTPSAFLPENVDNLWMQMLSMKPQMSKSAMFSHTPPTMDIDVGLGTFDFTNNFLDDFSKENGFSTFEAALDEPLRLDL